MLFSYCIALETEYFSNCNKISYFIVVCWLEFIIIVAHAHLISKKVAFGSKLDVFQCFFVFVFVFSDFEQGLIGYNLMDLSFKLF